MIFKALETERLILKNIDHSDKDHILDLFSNPDINRYLFDAEPIKDLKEAEEIINFYLYQEPQRQHRWVLVHKESGEKLGTCGFHCWDQENATVDMGYDLKIVYQGQGYMTEAINKILTFAKDVMGVQEIHACIYPKNLPSLKLVQKFNFEKIGHTVEVFRGQAYDHDLYGLYI